MPLFLIFEKSDRVDQSVAENNLKQETTVVTRLASGLVTLVVLGLILTGQSYARIDPEVVVGAWRFDEGRGDRPKDSSGNGNDGNLDAIGWGAPKWVEGSSGKTLQFDGLNNYVDSGDDKSLTLIDAGKFTYTEVMKIDLKSKFRRYIIKTYILHP